MGLVDADHHCRPIWQYLLDAAYFAIRQASLCPAFTRPPAVRLVAEPRGDDLWADGASAEGAPAWDWEAADADGA